MTGYILPLAFLAIIVVLLWVLIGAKGPWWMKLILITTLPAYAGLVYMDADDLRGWPTSKQPPRESILLWGKIHEPGDLGKGHPGRIDVLLQPMDGSADGKAPKTARNYQLPYSRNLHKAVQNGIDRAREGHPGALKRGKRHRGGGGRSGVRGSRDEESYESYDLPPAAAPKQPE
jgi:hypothetical protein